MTGKDPFFYKHLGFYFHALSRQYHNRMILEMKEWEMERAFLPLLIIEENQGCINQNDLAKSLYLDKVSTNRIITYLCSSGWIKKVTCQADKRKTLLQITGQGREILPAIQNAINTTNNLLLTPLNEQEQTLFFQLLDKMILHVEEFNNE